MWTRLRARVSRLLFVLARRRFDADTRLEIDAHLELLTERYERQGLSRDEAYIAARRQFGNTTVMRQHIHEMNSIRWIEQSVQDLRYAIRQLRGSAGFALVVIATLGIGIGGATAVYSVVRAVLLAPLPYQEPGQLVRFYQQEPGKPETRGVLAARTSRFSASMRRPLRTSPPSLTTLRPGSTWPSTGAPTGCAFSASRAAISKRSARTRARPRFRTGR